VRREGVLRYADGLRLDARDAAPVGPTAPGVLGGQDALASGVALLPAGAAEMTPWHPGVGVFDEGRSAYLRFLARDPGPLRDVVYRFAGQVRSAQGLSAVELARYGA
jgi:hypothetical protein